jgi:hypothetical protein
MLLKPMLSYYCSKFRGSYMPPAARIRVISVQLCLLYNYVLYVYFPTACWVITQLGAPKFLFPVTILTVKGSCAKVFWSFFIDLLGSTIGSLNPCCSLRYLLWICAEAYRTVPIVNLHCSLQHLLWIYAVANILIWRFKGNIVDSNVKLWMVADQVKGKVSWKPFMTWRAVRHGSGALPGTQGRWGQLGGGGWGRAWPPRKQGR